MDKLLILTVEWPYGKGETFFENEALFCKGFDEIECAPIYVSEKHRQIPSNIKIISNGVKLSKVVDIFQGIFNTTFVQEVVELLKSKRFSLHNLKTLLRFSMMTNYRYRFLIKWFNDNKNVDNVSLYTYWMASDAAAVARIRKKQKNIKLFLTRCHRFDLYEYATEGKYIPYRKLILDNVDKVMAISTDALEYLKNTYSNKYNDKYYISRLGTLDHGINPKNNNEIFRVVSCSNLIKVKRVDLMISALMHIRHKIEWIHFGDGVLSNSLQKMVKNLPLNVSFVFMGSVKNKELMEWYSKNHVDLFVNTSESEGIPVSIMEAMSFCIPVLATDVGGTGEIVRDTENGILIPKDIEAMELAKRIDKLVDERYSFLLCLREKARQSWEKDYNASVNYEKFYLEYLQNKDK